MSGRHRPQPRRHCPHCLFPENSTQQPADLQGQTCSATLGLDGPNCDRPATQRDNRGRPVCGGRVFTQVTSHIESRHRDQAQLAPAAQDQSATAPQRSSSAARGALTANDVRQIIRDELDTFARDTLNLPATAAQGPVALHPAGLCQDGRCPPCRAQRAQEHKQARGHFADEITAAVRHAGEREAAQRIASEGPDALADILEEWIEAGRPAPASLNQIGVTA